MEKTQQINCIFDDLSSLDSAYMPFIKGAGLFICTDSEYPLGTLLCLCISLMNESESYVVEGKVVWITPAGAQGNKPLGVGLQFVSTNGPYLSDLIERYLAEMVKSTQLTHDCSYF